MAFVTLEDQGGSVEVVVFSDIYLRSTEFLQTPGLPLLVRGTISQEEKGLKIIAQEIRSLQVESGRIPADLHLRLHTNGLDRELLIRLHAILQRHKGPIPTFLHFISPHLQEQILALPPHLYVKPSESLKEEVNQLFNYPVLDL